MLTLLKQHDVLCIPPMKLQRGRQLRLRNVVTLVCLAIGLASTTKVVSADAATDWPTYHHDFARTGQDAAQPPATSITPGWSVDGLDGPVFAEPLIVGNQVIVATEGDSVFALDSTSGNLNWATNLGNPVAANQLPCGNIDPVGITGTPVADAAAGVVYVAAVLNDPIQHQLFALSLVDGSVLWQTAIDPPGSDPLVQSQRGALALSSGRVYVPFGGSIWRLRYLPRLGGRHAGRWNREPDSLPGTNQQYGRHLGSARHCRGCRRRSVCDDG